MDLVYYLCLAVLVQDSCCLHGHAARAHESDTKYGSGMSPWISRYVDTIKMVTSKIDKLQPSRQVSVLMVCVHDGNQGAREATWSSCTTGPRNPRFDGRSSGWKQQTLENQTPPRLENRSKLRFSGLQKMGVNIVQICN